MKRSFATWLLLIVPSFCLTGQRVTAAPAFEGEVRIYYEFIRRSATFYVLLPGSHIHEGMPDGGLADFDFAKAQSATPKVCGTYVQSGGKMKITWGGGRSAETWAHEKMANGDESMDGNMWLKGVPFAAKQMLTGHYVWSAAVGDGATSTARTAGDMVFRPDGTFTDSATAYVSATVDDKGKKISGAASKATTGTYKLDGYTITLKQKSGTTTSKAIMAVGRSDDPAKPALLFLDGTLLRLKKQ